jgi:hypothetical protein
LSRLIGAEVDVMRELEGHLHALLMRLEVEDAADAGLQPGLLDRLDRAQPGLVADRGRRRGSRTRLS